MLTDVPRWLQTSTLTLGLLLMTSGGAAVAELPQFLPFRSISTDGSVGLWGDYFYRLAFDADFQLGPQSDGIRKGDDLYIVTRVTYPSPEPDNNLLGFALVRMDLQVRVDGDCFGRRGRRLIFELTEANRAACVEVTTEFCNALFPEIPCSLVSLSHLPSALTAELTPAGRRGRWKLDSVALFQEPGFPFPVAGFGYDAQGNLLSGVTLVVGDDGMFSPFRTVGFRTLAP